METIPLILLILFGSALLSYIIGKINYMLKVGVALAGILVSGFYFLQLYGQEQSFTFQLLGFDIIWRINPLSWFFGMLIFGLGILVAIFSSSYMKNKERVDFYCFALCMTIASMFGIVVSGDLLSFFFFWEIMTWSSFLMVIYYRFEAQAAGIKYFVMSMIGAYSMLIAILMVYAQLGTFSFDALAAGWSGFPLSFQLTLFILFSIGFGVKAAVMPLHTWAPDAYGMSPAPFSALFSGVLSKMGIYGFALLMFVFGAGKLAGSVTMIHGVALPSYILAWFGALTALIATLIAVMQDDAKKLLAYSSVGQLGYIILGFSLNSSMGTTAALFHAVNHTIFKGMLFLAVGAVFYRTGTRKLSEMGGLIRNMPYTFFVVLLGIITMAGVPPLSGFVGKWLIYEALLEKQMVLLAVVAFMASTAAFLYCYRLIFTIFLGQRPPRFDDVKEVPWTQRAPMLFLSLLTIYLGFYPYDLLHLIGQAESTVMGLVPMNLSQSILFNDLGHVSTMTVMNIVGTVFVIVFVLFNTLYKRSRKVGLKDIHTSGEVPGPEINLHYATDFYQPFSRSIRYVLERSADRFYGRFADNLEGFFDVLRYVYTGNAQTYALFVIMFLAMLLMFTNWLI
jgi:NADH-quinone oxidoreductase subunit M